MEIDTTTTGGDVSHTTTSNGASDTTTTGINLPTELSSTTNGSNSSVGNFEQNQISAQMNNENNNNTTAMNPLQSTSSSASASTSLPTALSSTPSTMESPIDTTPIEDGDDDDEDAAPLGSAIDDDDESGSDSSASDDGDDNLRDRRRVSHGADYIEVDSDGERHERGAHEYDDEEYSAATGRYSSRDLEYQRELESANACGLPHSDMTPFEREMLPEFVEYNEVYIEIRNLICRQWQSSITRYLTFDYFLTRSQLNAPKLRHCARRIFDFLNLNGFINCGLLPIAHDAKDKRPIELPVVENTPLVRRKSEAINGAASATIPVSAGENGTSSTVAAAAIDTSMTDVPVTAVKTEESANVKIEASSPPPAATASSSTDLNGDVAMKTEEELLKTEPIPVIRASSSSASPPVASSSSASASDPPPSSAPLVTPSALQPFTPKRILIIGAGASGLAAARHLQSYGHIVKVIEGRDRIGGRVNTMREKFSAPVDLGASIMTGLGGSPLAVLSKQITRSEYDVGFSTMDVLGKTMFEAPSTPFSSLMHYIEGTCPLYDSNGTLVDKELDNRMEEMWNKLLEANHALKVNSGHQCEPADTKLTKEERSKMRIPNPKDIYQMDVDAGIAVARRALGWRVSPAEEKLLNWHAANLEYGCATALNKLSLVYWDQDDAMAWEGDHALIKPGFGHFINHLSTDIDIVHNQHVNAIHYPPADDSSSAAAAASSSDVTSSNSVRVQTVDNLTGATNEFVGDFVMCTASLGVLKSNAISFSPPLPQWKSSAISSLGFGCLNKLILEFPHAFWKKKNDHDMFGYLPPGATKDRGKFYIFWNLERSTGRPILAALCAGEAAYATEDCTETSLVSDCMRALRAIHSESTVPDPIVTHQTKWSQDRYARGSYSFLAAGNTGNEYDALAKPVGSSLFFAGEACNRDYPATVPGAWLSGLRSAGLLQSRIQGWTSASADVLRELSKQKKSVVRSKQDTMATALTHQAVRELQRSGGGHTNEDELAVKIAEIMARTKRRRGIRHEIPNTNAEDIEMKTQVQDEGVATKLEAAARLLKQGLFAPRREHVTLLPAADARYAHIKRYDGALERPFDALKQDNSGLPSFKSFSDFDFEGTNFASSSSSSKLSSREQRHEKKRRIAESMKKHKKSKKSKSSSSHKSGSRKSSKHEKKESVTPEKHIHRYVGKIVIRLSSASATLQSAVQSHPGLLKKVQRKAGGKVYDDWKSKPRGDLKVEEWMNDKRKAKIRELVGKYLDIYAAGSTSSASIDLTATNGERHLPNEAASVATASHQPTPALAAAAASSSSVSFRPQQQQRGPRFEPTRR